MVSSVDESEEAPSTLGRASANSYIHAETDVAPSKNKGAAGRLLDSSGGCYRSGYVHGISQADATESTPHPRGLHSCYSSSKLSHNPDVLNFPVDAYPNVQFESKARQVLMLRARSPHAKDGEADVDTQLDTHTGGAVTTEVGGAGDPGESGVQVAARVLSRTHAAVVNSGFGPGDALASQQHGSSVGGCHAGSEEGSIPTCSSQYIYIYCFFLRVIYEGLRNTR